MVGLSKIRTENCDILMKKWAWKAKEFNDELVASLRRDFKSYEFAVSAPFSSS